MKVKLVQYREFLLSIAFELSHLMKVASLLCSMFVIISEYVLNDIAWCTSGVRLQVLPFIDNRHFEIILSYILVELSVP